MYLRFFFAAHFCIPGNKKIPDTAFLQYQGRYAYRGSTHLHLSVLPGIYLLTACPFQRNLILDYNGITGPDWGHSELVFTYFSAGILTPNVFLSGTVPYATLLFNVFTRVILYPFVLSVKCFRRKILSSATVFVFLAASAWAWIVTSDLLTYMNGTGFLLL